MLALSGGTNENKPCWNRGLLIDANFPLNKMKAKQSDILTLPPVTSFVMWEQQHPKYQLTLQNATYILRGAAHQQVQLWQKLNVHILLHIILLIMYMAKRPSEIWHHVVWKVYNMEARYSPEVLVTPWPEDTVINQKATLWVSITMKTLNVITQKVWPSAHCKAQQTNTKLPVLCVLLLVIIIVGIMMMIMNSGLGGIIKDLTLACFHLMVMSNWNCS